MFVCPVGHMAIRKARQGKNQALVFFFDIEKCRTCSKRNGCYKEGAKSKSYAVQIKSEEHQRQADFEKTEEFKAKAKVRYKIEAKNAELKNAYARGNGDFCRKYKKNPPIELRTALYYPKIRLSQLFRVNTGPYNRPTNQ